MRKRIAALFLCLCLTAAGAVCEEPGIDPRAVPDDGPPSADYYATIDPQTGERVYETRISIRNGIEPGMTMEEVRAAEGRKPDSEAEKTQYDFDTYLDQEAAGTTATLSYYYGDWGKLYFFGYVFSNDDIEKSESEYEKIEKSLVKKYGEENYTYDKLLGDIKEKAPEADKEMLGYFVDAKKSVRLLENGYIIHVLYESEYGIDHNLMYYAPDVLSPEDIRGI